jgi:AraC-like DNA-binding protein
MIDAILGGRPAGAGGAGRAGGGGGSVGRGWQGDVVYRELEWDLPAGVLWTRSAATTTGVVRVMPDGCIDLVWADGGLFVAGPDTVARDAPARSAYVGVRFHPGWAPTLLGVPAADLRDAMVPLDALWGGADARRLTEAAAGSAATAVAALTAAVRERLRRSGPPEPVIRRLAHGLGTGHSVSAVAARLGLSERQLHRRSLASFGYGPKTLARVLRFDRAVALARAGVPYATVAATVGYADQAHLAREVRALAGVPLTTLIAA